MTELKTLKDFKDLGDPNARGEEALIRDFEQNSNNELIEQLKQEAIKWIKEMDIKKSEDYCNRMMDFIINFFNLTKEDLKEAGK